jgi:pimeloyl-ACP methyl ester carboxylesterase
MSRRKTWANALIASVIAAFLCCGAQAQSRPELVMLGRLATVVWRPDSGAPHIAIIYENGSSEASGICGAMAAHGFVALCGIERPNTGAWERVALDIKAEISYLRAQSGITKIVLYGHSGGGAVASFYQATAENGVSFCQDPKKLSACGNDLANLPPADAVVFPDAHPGLAVMDLRMINPSMTSDGRRIHVDPTLDPFNPQNGFNPSGPSHYAPAFRDRYVAAQAAKMKALVARAATLRSALKSGAVTDPAADTVVSLGVGFATHLDELDPGIDAIMATRQPRRLLRNDGSIVVQPIHSVSVGNPEEAKFPGGPVDDIKTSASFLSRSAVRATDSLDAIDYCSSNSVTMCNTRSIHAPVLFIAMGANTFIADEERMYDSSPAKDKDYIVVEGALHGGQPCVKCEKTPGQYGNSQTNMYKYITDWINHRF